MNEEMCDACGYIGHTKHYAQEDKDLCVICANTFAGRAYSNPSQYPYRDVMVMVSKITNVLVDALDIRDGFDAALSPLPRIEAYIWWCGDDECDCTQPKIELVEHNSQAGRPWVTRTTLWEGTFQSQAEPGEAKAQRSELLAAIEAFKDRHEPIYLDGKPLTKRPLTD